MSKQKRQVRQANAAGAAAAPTRPATAAAVSVAPDRSWPLGALLALAFFVALRLGVGAPWAYDDYFHLGLVRELAQQFPLRTFPWTPLSILADPFVDKEPLFHLVLLPVARLPLETAMWIAPLLGQAFLVGCVVWFLWRQRVPHAWLWVLCLTAMGPLITERLQAIRPHVWMLGMSVVVLGLLFGRARWWVLALACAAFGQLHVAGWIGVLFAAVWVVAQRYAPGGETPLRLAPVAAAAGGWLAGQLVHPNVPHNFWLVWKVNVEIPLAAAGGSSRALREAIGIELQPPTPEMLLRQWPLFVYPLLALALLIRRPATRSPATLTLAVVALAFIVGGSLLLRRLLENGALLGILLLALVVATDERVTGRRLLTPRRRALAAAAVAIAVGWTVWQVRDFGRNQQRPLGRAQPLAMARFLGERGRPDAMVFTAQWADSAPLFYAAPQLRSLVVLDPTFLHAAEPQRLARYWAIANGRSGDAVGEMQRRFGATYATVWKAPAFIPLTRQLRRDLRARRIYDDPFYEVWELRQR